MYELQDVDDEFDSFLAENTRTFMHALFAESEIKVQKKSLLLYKYICSTGKVISKTEGASFILPIRESSESVQGNGKRN